MLPSAKNRVFQLNDYEIQQLLFCDNSDTEDALIADDEDIGFLESDIEQLEKTKVVLLIVLLKSLLDILVHLASRHQSSPVQKVNQPAQSIILNFKAILVQ